jgi:glutaredoxin 3
MAKIEIYTTPLCGYCSRAKSLLERKGAAYEETDLTVTPGARDIMIQRAGGLRTVPQIFIDGKHIGGSDDLQLLERNGQLDPLLA